MLSVGPILGEAFERANDSEPEAVAEALAMIGAMYGHEKTGPRQRARRRRQKRLPNFSGSATLEVTLVY